MASSAVKSPTAANTYLENRALIEEWAKLREPAAIALDRELLAAAVRLAEGGSGPPRSMRARATSVRLHVTTDPLPRAWWEKGKLLKGSESWPQLVIVMDPKDPRVRDEVKEATRSANEAHGLTSTGPKSSS